MAVSRFRFGRRRAIALVTVVAGLALSGCVPFNSPSKFGVSAAGDVHATAVRMREGGFKWMRLFVKWDRMQPLGPSLESSALDELDRQVNEYVARGFSIEIAFTKFVPAWARDNAQPRPCSAADYKDERRPASANAFYEYAKQMAGHFKDRVAAWELWVEPDVDCKFPGTPADFRRLVLVPGVAGIRSVQPNAFIVGATVANATTAQLDNWYTEEKRGPDGKNHRYLVAPVSAVSTNRFGSVIEVKAVMNMANNYSRCSFDGSFCVNKYVFNAYGFNEDQAANSAVQIEQHCMNQPRCVRTFYYASAYEGVDAHGNIYGTFGLLNPKTLVPRDKYYRLKDYHRVALPGRLVWSHSGPVPGFFCTAWNEGLDPHTWNDNFLCSLDDIGLQFSAAGPVGGKHCISVNEPSDPHAWSDNYLCTTAEHDLLWSIAGPIKGAQCLLINEPADPYTWQDNFLCYRV